MKLQIIAAVIALGLSSAAGAAEPAPRFDYTTEQSAQESSRAVFDRLALDRQKALITAIIKLGAVEGAVAYTDANGVQQVGIPPERLNKIAHGRTAEEIIALAASSSGPEVTLAQPAQ